MMRIFAKTGWLAIAALLALGGCNKSATPDNANSSNPSAPNAAAPNSSTPAAAPSSAPEAKSAPVRPAPKPIVIAAGSVLSVTVDQSISSKTASSGDHFDASLAQPVVVNGREVLHTGTKVSGVVTSAKSAGRFNGNAELGLALDSITFEGKNYRLHTSSVAQSGKGRGKRTGIGAGGGAAFGAIVGAIAGGGKGAAIGAAAGAGAGTAGAAFTGKRDIQIPAETALDFKLAQPVTIERNESR
jgi:hypothetical protein